MSNLFLRKPRLTILALALIAVAGLSAMEVLPRREDPELTSRNALVITPFPGATAERVERLVTDKLEEELSEIEEIGLLESSSRAGISSVMIELRDEITEPDEVWSRIRDRLDDAVLPAGAGEPDFEEQVIDAWSLIIGLRWTGEDAPPLTVMARLAEDLEDRLRGLSGTAEADVYGAPSEELRVEIDPARMAALGLTPEGVAADLARADAKVAAGRMHSKDNDLLVEVAGELDALDRIANVPVRAGADGRLLRLGDVARVEKGTADPADELALLDGDPGVAVAARIRSASRIDRWAVGARAIVDEFAADMPDALAVEVLFDQSVYTEDRLRGLVSNLLLGASLVMLVVLVTMGWRSALLVGAALPLSALMVLAGMRFLGVPIHQMSVTGLIIALGLLIDNAIVIVDETRHRLRSEDRLTAVSGAVRALGVPLLGSTITTVLAFMPLVLAPGPVGEFVGAMSLSVVLAVISSFALSLTVLPALTAWLEGFRGGAGDGWWAHGVSSKTLERAWRRILGAIVAHPVLGVFIALVLPVMGFVSGAGLQEQFFPPSGRDQAQVEVYLDELATIERTHEAARVAHAALAQHPDVRRSEWFVGASAPKFYYNMLEAQRGAPGYAQALVSLHSPDDSQRVLREIQFALDDALPGAQVLVKQLEQGPPFDAPIELRLEGEDLDSLRSLGEELRAELAAVPEVVHTRSDLQTERPKLVFEPRDEDLERAGLDRVTLARRLEAALDGAIGGSLIEGEEEIPLRVRVADADRDSLDAIASLALAGPGGWTPLSALGELGIAPEVGTIPHHQGRRSATVQGYLTAGTLPADALDAYLARLDGFEERLPPGVTMTLGGEGAERDEALGNLAASVGILLVMMVATLVLSFGSFRRAAVIGVVGFLAVGLSLGALRTFGHPFGFMAIVGTMGLIGIAINDSIVVLAALMHDSRAASGDRAAMVDVTVRATRHVLSTTLTTMLGFLPLLMEGNGLWPPLATAVAGGVGGATLLALTLIPAMFAWTTPAPDPSPEPPAPRERGPQVTPMPAPA